MSHEPTPSLTPEQRRIVEMPPDARLLVTAGPGTGKTHTLVARVAHLADAYDLSPAEMLLLTFSRAAVAEIRRRAAASDGFARYAAAYTFDAFATRLLARVAPDETWKTKGYDGRIIAATDLLRTNADARAMIADFRHVLLDEIQDLVAERAAFVEAIISAAAGGFSLFGDPAQAIYGFQHRGDMPNDGSAILYRHLREYYADTLTECSLEHNHRVERDAAAVALPFGARLRAASPDYGDIAYELETISRGLSGLGTIEQAVSFLRSVPGTTALLCRTNGEALSLSRALHAHAVPHRLQRGAADRVAPVWIAAALGGLDQSQISRKGFFDHTSDFLPDDLTPDAAWDRLKWAEGEVGNTLDIARVADAVRVGTLPEDLYAVEHARLIISTVHRAKGLEFDRVILVESREGADVDVALAEEARVRFVALSRPRRALFRMDGPNTRALSLDKASGRWVQYYEGWKVAAVEFRGSDTHSDSPPGRDLGPTEDPRAIQDYLRAAVHPGDPVALHRWLGVGHPETDGFYRVMHGDRMIGVTSEACSRDLAPVFRARRPTGFEGLHVEAVETVAGTAAMARRAGLGATGLWLRVRIAGLGHCSYAARAATAGGGIHVTR